MKGIIDAINQENLKSSIPQFNVGDTVKVMVKVIEGDRERLQA
ncbi:MAG: 50S ribosomal protein L19, partial [Clostridia bacterium]|nr:50S ribosomal protein L19 [Clostridia bacterium]